MAIELSNTLYLGKGPLLRLSTASTGAPTAITLKHVTQRGGTAVVEIKSNDSADEISEITLDSVGCAFAPDNGGSLLALIGRGKRPTIAGKLQSIQWNGNGSLVEANTPVAIWRNGEKNEELADDALAIDGMVAIAMEFAGPVTPDPAASLIKRWLAPLQSDEPPGIPADLPKLPAIER